MRNRLTKRMALGGLVAAIVAVVAGCEKKYVPPPVDTAAIVGDWIQFVEETPVNPRVRAAEPSKYLRHLTINGDNTFVFTICTKDGKPVKDSWKATGNWAARASEKEAEMLYFDVGQSGFSESEAQSGWVPVSSVGVRKHELSGRGETEALIIEDAEGESATYVRQ